LAVQITDKKGQTDDRISPEDAKMSRHDANINVRRRFQFSSLLKRMSTISLVRVGGKNGGERALISVKGAPETLKGMYAEVPAEYEKTYKWFAQRGSRVLALGYKWVDGMGKNEVRLASISYDI
jgi:cation-transporting ATPase 13A1